MRPIELIIIALNIVGIIMIGAVLCILKKHLDHQKNKDRAKDEIILGMARVTLLENYRLCEVKGFYSAEDRDVYGKLYRAYRSFGGDAIIDEMGEKLRELPMHYEAK